MRRKFMLFLAVLVSGVPALSQVVTSDPAIPYANQGLTVYFDATQGSGGLAGYTGDVHAHTGVITSNSTGPSDWKYVKTEWDENTPETQLTRISDDYYKLEITPDIQTFYGVPAGETISQVAFVFRSSEPMPGSSQYYEGKDDGGKDIFIDVFEEGLNVSILSPSASSIIVDLNDTIQIVASASLADSISLYINDLYTRSVHDSDSLTHQIIADEYGDSYVCVYAYGDGETVADSFFYYVRQPIVVSPLPEGLETGINYTSDTSVTFVLYAPLKESAYLLSDFTKWSACAAGAMKITPDGKHFWLEFGGLEPGREYPFQYLVDGNIRIADPYADKYLDSWNDGYITEETYPGLIPYPIGKTDQMVSVFQTAQEDYQWKNTSFDPPERSALNIYELLVRDFLAAHDFKTLTDTLDYLDRLGINAIELMPVNEFDGNINWGYSPAFYFAPDKYYGPKNTLKAFVDSCHGRGIAVIQDMVLNHSFGQHSLARLYLDENTWQPSPENPWYNETAPNPVYNWGYDFDHESPDTKEFIDRVNRYWLTEYQMDGFRFDFTKGFTNSPGDGWAYDSSRISILKRMADTIWNTNPDTYVILEHFTANEEEEELSDYGMMIWGNMNGAYAQITRGLATNLEKTSSKARGWKDPHLVAYMESHDEERVQYIVKNDGLQEGDYDVKTFENRMERMGLSAVIFLSIPGPKMIWQFGELGYSISIGDGSIRTDPKPILWDLLEDRRRQRLYQVYSSMLHLRKQYPVFQTDDYRYKLYSLQQRINLDHPDMNVTVIGNFGLSEADVVPLFQSTGHWYEYFTGEVLEVENTNNPLTLRPGEYRLYTSVQLDTPDIISEIPEIGDRRAGNTGGGNGLCSVYPNPSDEIFNISLSLRDPAPVTIRILDISGREIRRLLDNEIVQEGSVSRWDGRTRSGSPAENGIYLLQILTPDRSDIIRIVKN